MYEIMSEEVYAEDPNTVVMQQSSVRSGQRALTSSERTGPQRVQKPAIVVSTSPVGVSELARKQQVPRLEWKIHEHQELSKNFYDPNVRVHAQAKVEKWRAFGGLR